MSTISSIVSTITNAPTTTILQSVGVLFTLTVGAGNLAIDVTTLPRVQEHASTPAMLRIWQTFYNSGKRCALTLTFFSALAWSSALYQVGLGRPQTPFLIGALAGTVGIAPFTVLFMEPGVNQRLKDLDNKLVAGGVLTEAEDKKARNDFAEWLVWNNARAAISFVGAISGLISLW